jgi:uncharacterized protein (TIGR00251 family)
MLPIREDKDGIQFKVYVQPRSSRTEIVGRHDDALKIKLTAPPVDNAANQMCVRFLADCLKLPKASLEIISGHTGRTKQVRINQKAAGKSKKDLAAAVRSFC